MTVGEDVGPHRETHRPNLLQHIGLGETLSYA